MRLLITPALSLSEQEHSLLSRQHTVYTLADERLPLAEQPLSFDPTEIEGIVCNFFFQHNALSCLPNLRVVQLTSAGLDRVPVEEFKERGIRLFNAGATYAVPMAEWALTKLLEIVKGSEAFRRNQEAHGWNKERRLRELYGMTAAVIGFGNVGREVAVRLWAFGVSVTAVDIVPPQGEYDRYVPIDRLDEVLPEADVVILTVPLTPQTKGLIDRVRLARMKHDAVLINIARGGIVDEDALAEALHNGRLAGAALDVFETEPLPPEHPLWECPRLLLSPHNSFVGDGNHGRLFSLVCRNLQEADRECERI